MPTTPTKSTFTKKGVMKKIQKKASAASLAEIKDLEAVAKKRAVDSNPFSKNNVLDVGSKEFQKFKNKKNVVLSQDDYAFKMLTLFELDNSLLLMQGFGEAYKTMAIDLSKQFQSEYGCKTPSEKTTAHLAAQNYMRTLELQRMISLITHADTYNDLKLKRIAILEKAYDRACNQYAVSLHSLKTMRQKPMNVTVNAVSANIAQQQMVQENNNVKAK